MGGRRLKEIQPLNDARIANARLFDTVSKKSTSKLIDMKLNEKIDQFKVDSSEI